MTEKKEPVQDPEPLTPLTEEEQAKQALDDRIAKFRTRYGEVSADLPEAGGIAFMTVYLGNVPVNVTSRASNPYDAMATLLSSVSLAKHALGIAMERQTTSQPPANPPVVQGSFGPPESVPNATQPDAPAQPAIPIAANKPAPDGVKEFIAVKFEIVPRADGKAEMKFYEAGHKFPDLYSVMSLEYCVKNMEKTGEWTEQHFKQAATYDVNYRVKWKNSDKLNSKGNPYKDIVSIEPA